jgi:outer membrane immunogenic protein
MKKITLRAVVFAAIGVAPALAADLPAGVYTKAPPIGTIYDWSGFYIGGNIGYGWGQSHDTSTINNTAGMTLFTNTDKTSMNGVFGGGQVGYNWQMQRIVVGLEADIQGTDEKGSRSFICPTTCSPGTFTGIILPNGTLLFTPGPAVPATMSQKLDWFGTVRARAGALVDPKVLVYATGGLAYGEARTSETIGVVPATFSSTNTNIGWTLGVGVEGALGGNWTAKLEYLYLDLGKLSGVYLTPSPAFGGGFLNSSYNSRVTDNVLRVGVNYKFGGSVAARY